MMHRQSPRHEHRPTGRGPLAGTRLLDFTRLYPGPLGAMILAELGAEVIKVEDLVHPDPMRAYPPTIDGQSAGYQAVNRGKRAIAIQFADQEGKEILLDLIRSADLLFENFRPEVAARLGLDFDRLATVNPGIICVSVTGYGQTGPYRNQAGHDLNYIGLAGILDLMNPPGTTPKPPPLQMADVAGGAYMSAIGALAALYARKTCGRGQRVDVSMLEGVLPLLTLQLAHQAAGSQLPGAGIDLLAGATACYGVYECGDGRRIALAALEPKFWTGFCDLVQRPEWIGRQFSDGSDQLELIAEVRSLFASRTRDQWLAIANSADICLTPVWNLDEVARDPHLQARNSAPASLGVGVDALGSIGMVPKFSGTPTGPIQAAPDLGRDGREILDDLGYSDARIADLTERGIIL